MALPIAAFLCVGKQICRASHRINRKRPLLHINSISNPCILTSNKCLSTDKEFAECSQRVFSGIQPTGVPHLGNYGGAILNWVKLQKRYNGQMLLSIVDLHSLTSAHHIGLRQKILDMTACLLACGIDPHQIILYQQSRIPYHAELAWILSCLCSIPKIQRMAQWKDKKEKVKDPSVGLLTYPILQAADIMLYKSTLVPAGDDQIQHIEFTRDMCRAFNREHGIIFPECQMVEGETPKIRSLRKPGTKMSKSEADSKSRIELLDTPEEVAQKIKKAVTDFTSEVTYDPVNRPGVSNLIDIHALMADMCVEDIVEESFLKAEDTAMYKTRLSDVINENLAPIRDKALQYKMNEKQLWDVLQMGTDKAAVIAESTMEEVKSVIGMS